MTRSKGKTPDRLTDDGLVEYATRTTAKEVVEYFDLSNDRWAGGRVSSWVFRGVRLESYDLRPSAWRPKVISHNTWRPTRLLAREYAKRWIALNKPDGFKKYPDLAKALPEGNAKKQEQHLLGLVEQIRWEQLLQRRFVQLADELGFNVGGSFAQEHEQEYPPFTAKLVTPYPKQATAFAQHHHIPTRLLDWTRSPLKSLFFAAEGNLKKPLPQTSFAVWALNVRYLACLETVYRGDYDQWDKLGVFHMYAQKAGHGFLQAQDGLFTWIHGWEKPYLKSLEFPDLPQALKALHAVGNATGCGKQFEGEPILRKLTAPARLVPELLRLLELQQITKCRLMPTLDNIAETLRMEAMLPATPQWIPEAQPMEWRGIGRL